MSNCALRVKAIGATLPSLRGDIRDKAALNDWASSLRESPTNEPHRPHLHPSRYLSEFDFRYSNRPTSGIKGTMRTVELPRCIDGERLTYRRIRQAAYA